MEDEGWDRERLSPLFSLCGISAGSDHLQPDDCVDEHSDNDNRTKSGDEGHAPSWSRFHETLPLESLQSRYIDYTSSPKGERR